MGTNTQKHRWALLAGSLVAGVIAVNAVFHNSSNPERDDEPSPTNPPPAYVLTPEDEADIKMAEAVQAEFQAYEDKSDHPPKKHPKGKVISLLDPDYYPQ